MPTVVTSQAGTVRAARPEAALIVLFLVVALFIFITGSRRKGSRTESNSSATTGSVNDGDGGVAEVGRGGKGSEATEPSRTSRRGERQSQRSERDRLKGKESKSKSKSKSKKNKSTKKGNETPASTTTASDSGSASHAAKRKKKEKERKRKKARHKAKKEKEEKEKERKRKKDKLAKEAEEKAEKQKKAEQNKTPTLPGSPDPGDPLSDKLWKRDPNKRPERPSGRDSPVLLKRGEDGKWIRPPLSGKKGVSFADGGIQGKELTSIVSYNGDDATNILYDQSHTDRLRNHVSIEKGRDGDVLYGAVDGSQTPLKGLLDLKEDRPSDKLIKMMKRAEWFCLIDWQDPRVVREVMAAALKDSWITKVGPIPEIIHDILQQIIIEKAVDVTMIMLIKAAPLPQFIPDESKTDDKSKATRKEKITTYQNNFFKHCLDGGIDVKELEEEAQIFAWPNWKVGQIHGVVEKWVKGKEEANDMKGLMAMILGFFVPSYRAATSYKPLHFEKDLPMAWAELIGPKDKLITDWLRYIGKAFIISRMFSPVGADLEDLSARVNVVRRREIAGFILDYTLFLPPVNGNDKKKLAKMLGGRTLEYSSHRVKYLALLWINHLNENVWPGKPFARTYPIHICRLTLRPALPLADLDPKVVTKCLQAGNKRPKAGLDEQRATRIMKVSSNKMDEMYLRERKEGESGDAFSRLFRQMGIQQIRFVNQRQFHWYNPTNTMKPMEEDDRFDDATFQLILVLFRCVSSSEMTPTYKDKQTKKHMNEPDSVMDLEYDVRYSQIQSIDFGGVLPVEIPTETKRYHRFLTLDPFKGLSGLMIPFVPRRENENNKEHPSTASLILEPNWGLFDRLHSVVGSGNGTGAASGAVDTALTLSLHSKQYDDRDILVAELGVLFLQEISRWLGEAKQDRDPAGRIQYVKQKIKVISQNIRERISFVPITKEEERYSAEKHKDRNRQDLLREFHIPLDRLPEELRDAELE